MVANGEKREASLIPMLLAVMAVAGVLVTGGIYIFARYISEKVNMDVRPLRDGGKSIRVDTPAGRLKLRGEASEADLRLPFYPGGKRRQDVGATFSLEMPATGAFEVAAAEFETADPPDKVAAWYRQRLGADAKEKKVGDELRFLLGSDAGNRRIVVLKRIPEGTRISMANIIEAGTN
jgi:hypothetical protein